MGALSTGEISTTLLPAAQGDIGALTQVFQLLADPTRLNIVLILLAQGERNVTTLCRDLQLPQPTVSHHLGLLRGGNLVECRRQGKQIFYSIRPGSTNARDEKELRIEFSRFGVHLFSVAPP